MKKNIFIRLFSVILCLLMLASCGKAVTFDSKTAVWEGYKDMPFNEFLEKGFVAMMDADGIKITKSKVSVENGWKKSNDLDTKSDLTDGFKAVTYVLDVSDSADSCAYAFFMEQDSKDVLVCKGGALIADGETMDFEKASGEEALGQLIPFVQ